MTKKQIIVDWIKESLRNRLMQPGDKLPSEKELSERFNVSRGSVRQSLQALITEGLLESLQGVGTFVRQAARSETPLVAFVCYRNYSYIFPEMIHGFNRLLQSHNRHLVLGETRYDLDLERRVVTDLVENGSSGIVVTPAQNDAGESNLDLFRRLEADGIPVVFLDNDLGSEEFDAVVQDNNRGGRLAAETLIARGHGRIGIVYSRNYFPKLARLEGVRSTLEEAGLGLDPRHVLGIEGQASARRAYLQIRDYVYGVRELPSAFICSGDDEALMLMRCLERKGLSIPEDVSLISFDNSDISKYTHPPLTTMDHPSMQMGELAAKVLLGRLEGGGVRARTRIVVDPAIVYRRSVGDGPREELRCRTRSTTDTPSKGVSVT